MDHQHPPTPVAPAPLSSGRDAPSSDRDAPPTPDTASCIMHGSRSVHAAGGQLQSQRYGWRRGRHCPEQTQHDTDTDKTLTLTLIQYSHWH